jgi:hypothetical protein
MECCNLPKDLSMLFISFSLMDFSSDREDEHGFASRIPASVRTNQSADEQLSYTESHDGIHNHTASSFSTHVQVPGHVADVSYAPAAMSTLGSSGSGGMRNNNSLESSIQSDVIRVDVSSFWNHSCADSLINLNVIHLNSEAPALDQHPIQGEYTASRCCATEAGISSGIDELFMQLR